MAILKYSGGLLNYTLVRRSGMKNIKIKIKFDGSICVSADTSVTLSRIEEAIIKNREWITESIRKVEENKNNYSETEIKNGAILSIFGDITTLCVKPNINNPSVYREGKILTAEVTNTESQTEVEMLLLRYIAEKGRSKAEELISFYLGAAGYSGDKPTLILKFLKSKWGHYNPRKNEIMLNYALAGLPFSLIEYVAAHEAAHVFVRNHSAEFYDFGERLIRGFKKLDKELKKYKPDLWSNIIINK